MEVQGSVRLRPAALAGGLDRIGPNLLSKEAWWGRLAAGLGSGLRRLGSAIRPAAAPMADVGPTVPSLFNRARTAVGEKVYGMGTDIGQAGVNKLKATRAAAPPSFGDVMAGKAPVDKLNLAPKRPGLLSMENPWTAQMLPLGVLMGAPMALDAMKGEDPQQARIRAAQGAGMHLAQAASLNDPAAFQQVVGSKGMHPAVSQALTAMWQDRRYRPMLANQDAAANLVYQMHEHLRTNPQLTGQQLAQVMSNQTMGSVKRAADIDGLEAVYAPLGAIMGAVNAEPGHRWGGAARGFGYGTTLGTGAILGGAAGGSLARRLTAALKRRAGRPATMGQALAIGLGSGVLGAGGGHLAGHYAGKAIFGNPFEKNSAVRLALRSAAR